MLKIREAIIVEGKYDKQKLREIVDAPIITTSGFRIFKDKEKQALIRTLAKERGILVMTDSDSAGGVIRNFLKGIVPESQIKQCYVPLISGKEKRKDAPSKENLLGVEGIDAHILKEALIRCGVVVGEEAAKASEPPITKTELFEWGLSGRDNSAELRQKLLADLGLPLYLSCNSMLEIVNSLYTRKEILDKIEKL